MIQAIPTNYGGHKFRSRLEARWALFFDLIGVPWEYEREAFSLVIHGKPVGYTPDFWLPTQGIWFEAKPETSAFPDEQERHAMLLKLLTFSHDVDSLNVAFGTPEHAEIVHSAHSWPAEESKSRNWPVTWGRCVVCLSWDLGVEGVEKRTCGHTSDRIGHAMVEGALKDASAYRFWNP